MKQNYHMNANTNSHSRAIIHAKTQTLKMTIVSGLRIIDSNAQTGITWWNWTVRYNDSC
jgi:hypothetical protein